MPRTLIQSNPEFKKEKPQVVFLQVSEMFSDTIQGEGVSAGCPSTFIRLQNCTLNCTWCDTTEVWRVGNPYTIQELLTIIQDSGLEDRLYMGQHLILTGGSPLLQEVPLIFFIEHFIKKFGFKPYIEVENECVRKPSDRFIELVDQWNNSPKLANSGMKKQLRHKPEILSFMNELSNSWFKFVVSSEEDWEEIVADFLPFLNSSRIILMPEGDTQEKLKVTRPIVAELASKYGVRFSDRLHVTCWDKKTGV